MYSNNLRFLTTFLTIVAAIIPIKKFKTGIDINLVDKAKAPTPARPLIADHLYFLNSSLFLALLYP